MHECSHARVGAGPRLWGWLLPTTACQAEFLDISRQIDLLEERGMIIKDRADARRRLEQIGYYRLSGYWYSMRKVKDRPGNIASDKSFVDGTEFTQIVELYVFDKKLRFLFLDAIERVEVGLRAAVARTLGPCGPAAHTDPGQMSVAFTRLKSGDNSTSDHQEWINKYRSVVNSSKDEIIKKFRISYPNDDLPVWMAVEVMNFGALSRLMYGMGRHHQEAISSYFGIPRVRLMNDWTRSISETRNTCAHHGRLWNRPPKFIPVPPTRGACILLDHICGDTHAQRRLYVVALALRMFLRKINPTSSWAARLSRLCQTFPKAPGISLRQAGFPENWEQLPVWQQAAP